MWCVFPYDKGGYTLNIYDEKTEKEYTFTEKDVDFVSPHWLPYATNGQIVLCKLSADGTKTEIKRIELSSNKVLESFTLNSRVATAFYLDGYYVWLDDFTSYKVFGFNPETQDSFCFANSTPSCIDGTILIKKRNTDEYSIIDIKSKTISEYEKPEDIIVLPENRKVILGEKLIGNKKIICILTQ